MNCKCPRCNGCMIDRWILPNHYLYCEFCRLWYTNFNNILKDVTLELKLKGLI